MKKTLLLLSMALIMCSCASYKLEKTVWSTASAVEKDGEKGVVITSLLFRSPEDVDIYSAVVVDKDVVVTPFKFAEGKYVVSGNPKKEAEIKITGSNIQNQNINYKGVYRKADAMFLISQDSIPYIFGIQKNVKIQ
jgi:protein-disulfide isomerase